MESAITAVLPLRRWLISRFWPAEEACLDMVYVCTMWTVLCLAQGKCMITVFCIFFEVDLSSRRPSVGAQQWVVVRAGSVSHERVIV